MKKLLAAMFVALLMGGCGGGEDASKDDEALSEKDRALNVTVSNAEQLSDNGLYDEAVISLRQAYAGMDEGSSITIRRRVLRLLSHNLVKTNNSKDALDFAQQLVSIADDDQSQAEGMLSLGVAYAAAENYVKASASYGAAIKIYQKLNDNESLGASYANLGDIYHAKGESAKAIEYYEKSLREYLNALGQEHSSVANSYHRLGVVYEEGLGDYAKAIMYYEKALPIYRKTIGPEHPLTKSADKLLSGAKFGDFSTPEATINTFIRSATTGNAEVLSRCFHERAAGEFDDFRNNTLNQKQLTGIASMLKNAKIAGVDIHTSSGGVVSKTDTSRKKSGRVVVTVDMPNHPRGQEYISLVPTDKGLWTEHWQIVDF
jgi:tetratricopeptide (TPR) repeat protein